MIIAQLDDKRVEASRELSRSPYYTCVYEYCDYPSLILKKGLKNIPHFAHKTKSLCSNYSEGQTNAHEAMKKVMSQLLNIGIEFIEYGKIKGVRPDLVYHKSEEERYAIEVQHSPIKIEELARRNMIYIENNYIPIWIFHQNEEFDYYYEQGKYGKHDFENNGMLLKIVERYLLKMQHFLLYLSFVDYQRPKTNPYDITQKNGVYFRNYRPERIEDKKIRFTEKYQSIFDNQRFYSIIKGLQKEDFLLTPESFIERENESIEHLKWNWKLQRRENTRWYTEDKSW